MKLGNLVMFGVFVILPIIVGVAIYVGWRATSLAVFDWMAVCCIPTDVFRPAIGLPQSLLYSLPDACWVFAGTSWMHLIWHRMHPWVFIFLILAIGAEVGQALCIVPGVFDWIDIVFYIGGFLLALSGYTHAQTLLVNYGVIGDGRARSG